MLGILLQIAIQNLTLRLLMKIDQDIVRDVYLSVHLFCAAMNHFEFHDYLDPSEVNYKKIPEF